MNRIFEEVEENGFAILENVLNDETVSHLITELSKLKSSSTAGQRRETLYGVRNLLNLCPGIREFSQSRKARCIAESFQGEEAQVVRAIYFDKTRGANWKVPLHQDLTIAVRERLEAEGFSAWTLKTGIQHVQPPVEILRKMLTLRFHLDDAGETNGALKIVPRSHKNGRLSADEIKIIRKANGTRLCSVKRGDCLIMRPLLLHSSSAGSNPSRRRVIHLEFSAESLPGNLNWYGS